MDGYCVKCKAKKTIKGGKRCVMANGGHCMKGTCCTCGTKMCRILPKGK